MLYHLWLNWKVGFSQKLTNRETTIILVKMNAVCSLGQFFISLFPLQEHILWLPITWTPEFFEALIRGSSICFHCISEKPDVSVLLYFLWYGYGTTNFVIFQVCLAGEWDTQQLRKWRRLLLLIAFDIHGIRTLLGPVSDPKRWPAHHIASFSYSTVTIVILPFPTLLRFSCTVKWCVVPLRNLLVHLSVSSSWRLLSLKGIVELIHILYECL